jgi:hypothetical protein
MFKTRINIGLVTYLVTDLNKSLHGLGGVFLCRMDLPRPATSVGTRTDYSVGP